MGKNTCHLWEFNVHMYNDHTVYHSKTSNYIYPSVIIKKENTIKKEQKQKKHLYLAWVLMIPILNKYTFI